MNVCHLCAWYPRRAVEGVCSHGDWSYSCELPCGYRELNQILPLSSLPSLFLKPADRLLGTQCLKHAWLVSFAVVRKDRLQMSQETVERLGLLLGDVRVWEEAEAKGNGSVGQCRCVVCCAMSGPFCSERSMNLS